MFPDASSQMVCYGIVRVSLVNCLVNYFRFTLHSFLLLHIYFLLLLFMVGLFFNNKNISLDYLQSASEQYCLTKRYASIFISSSSITSDTEL